MSTWDQTSPMKFMVHLLYFFFFFWLCYIYLLFQHRLGSWRTFKKGNTLFISLWMYLITNTLLQKFDKYRYFCKHQTPNQESYNRLLLWIGYLASKPEYWLWVPGVSSCFPLSFSLPSFNLFYVGYSSLYHYMVLSQVYTSSKAKRWYHPLHNSSS